MLSTGIMLFWGLSKAYSNATLKKKKLIAPILSGEIFIDMVIFIVTMQKKNTEKYHYQLLLLIYEF